MEGVSERVSCSARRSVRGGDGHGGGVRFGLPCARSRMAYCHQKTCRTCSERPPGPTAPLTVAPTAALSCTLTFASTVARAVAPTVAVDTAQTAAPTFAQTAAPTVAPNSASTVVLTYASSDAHTGALTVAPTVALTLIKSAVAATVTPTRDGAKVVQVASFALAQV